ncbi:hypothetical protein QCA50_015155 [Cerrena zonata]|uniref:Uncharacterized protein n=1 Tax=Cerrena zonata TaxID=2478898 RepID=A0AAW0FKY6_9APHY
MLSMFNGDKKQEKNIRKQVTEEASLIAQRSAEIDDKIPKETDHPLLNDVKHEGSQLAEGGDLLLERLDTLSTLKKPFKKFHLGALIEDADQYSKDVAIWNNKAKTSIDLHNIGYLNTMMSPTQSGATTRNNSASSSSSTINETYVHPATYWDWALVDKINASVKTRPANLTSDRTNELGSDVQ